MDSPLRKAIARHLIDDEPEHHVEFDLRKAPPPYGGGLGRLLMVGAVCWLLGLVAFMLLFKFGL